MPDCIIVRKPCCGAVVMAQVKTGYKLDKETKKELLELIAQGCSVEHLSVEETRKQTFGCKCKKDDTKGLFDKQGA